MNRPSIITGAADRMTAPHRPEGADVPQSLTPIGARHRPPVDEPSNLTGGTGAPNPADTHYATVRAELLAEGLGTGPRCIECRHNVSMCLCDVPEPDVMPVDQMKLVMPELFEPLVEVERLGPGRIAV